MSEKWSSTEKAEKGKDKNKGSFTPRDSVTLLRNCVRQRSKVPPVNGDKVIRCEQTLRVSSAICTKNRCTFQMDSIGPFVPELRPPIFATMLYRILRWGLFFVITTIVPISVSQFGWTGFIDQFFVSTHSFNELVSFIVRGLSNEVMSVIRPWFSNKVHQRRTKQCNLWYTLVYCLLILVSVRIH